VSIDSVATLTLDEDGAAVVSLVVAGIRGGGVGLGITNDDPAEMTHLQAQKALADSYHSIVDNAWPDELTDPWPMCPVHNDHPLQPGLHNTTASWTCSRGAVHIPLGGLVSESADMPVHHALRPVSRADR
jgi:hypothetical protein